MFSLCFLLCASVLQVYAQWPCPLAEDISPCICSVDINNNLIMDCDSVMSDTELCNIFTNSFPFSDFHLLTIQHVGGVSDSIVHLTSGCFGSLSFEKIMIEKTSLAEIHEDVFSLSHPTLKELYLRDNKISLFPFETIPSFTELSVLYLDGNNLTDLTQIESSSLTSFDASDNPNVITIRPTIFQNAPALSRIHLDNIGLSVLPTDLFKPVAAPAYIHMANNKLNALNAADIFSASFSIKEIDLSNNRISSVAEGAIFGMNGNGFIVLGGNLIEELPFSIWAPIFNEVSLVQSIDLQGNPLLCGCDVGWIVSNPTQLNKLTLETTCMDGTAIIDLDPDVFPGHCTSTPLPPKV